jgi:hypothetical protein
MRHVFTWAAIALVCGSATASAQSFASDVGVSADNVRLGDPEYSPYIHRSFPDQVFFGDTHLHSSYSTDAGMIGNYLGPDDAFRFARGETVTASAGQRARLIRPLDFLVVADHSEKSRLGRSDRGFKPTASAQSMGQRGPRPCEGREGI